MLKGIHCNIHEQHFHYVTDIDQVSEIKQDPTAIFWLDVLDPTEEELEKIRSEFDLHLLAIEDASHEHQRPKVDEYEQFFFVVFYTINLGKDRESLDICELDMFLGRNYLITVHEKPLSELKEVEQRWTHNVHKLEWGIGVLLYSLLDTIVDSYFPIIDELVERTEELEDRMYSGNGNPSAHTLEILKLKKQFMTLRRIASPERDVLNILTNRDNSILEEHVLIYFRDVYDHITRFAETVDLYRDQIASTIDANISIASNDLNKVMRTLTAASIILMANSLVAGIYGMNFDNMPELHLTYGYFLILGIMALITIGLVIYFWRLKWLS
jgi:magnesium transporter